MVGVIPADTQMHRKPQGRGYVELEETADMPWAEAKNNSNQKISDKDQAALIKAHEFHYSRLINISSEGKYAYNVKRGVGITGDKDGWIYKNLLANYSHLRNTNNFEWAKRFVNFVQEKAKNKEHSLKTDLNYGVKKQMGTEVLPLRIAIKVQEDGSFHYNMGFDDNTHDGDKSFIEKDINFVVDAATLPLIGGMTMDYLLKKATVKSVEDESLESNLPYENETYEKEPEDYQVPKDLIKLPWFARTAFSILFVFFVIIGATYFWAIGRDDVPQWIAPLMTFLWVVTGVGVLGLLFLMWRQFSLFCTDLTDWANELLQGDLSSRMLIRSSRCPSEGIRLHVNKISEDYEALAKFERQRFERQARRIEQKKYYLGVLYDVSATINKSNNLEDLLQRFLHTLTNVVKAEAATVRLLDKDNQMRLVASYWSER
ncbi:Cobyrinate a,c-diamide synthase [Nymphon striatum]|nr:Cobyrinate a,c-diamide synthase [Nymphon striatum]